MCYPCSGCNGCGKLDSELFSYLKPKLLCPSCHNEYTLGQEACSECGMRLPKPPGDDAVLATVSADAQAV